MASNMREKNSHVCHDESDDVNSSDDMESSEPRNSEESERSEDESGEESDYEEQRKACQTSPQIQKKSVRMVSVAKGSHNVNMIRVERPNNVNRVTKQSLDDQLCVIDSGTSC
jgi:hypothetical protein